MTIKLELRGQAILFLVLFGPCWSRAWILMGHIHRGEEYPNTLSQMFKKYCLIQVHCKHMSKFYVTH